MSALFVIAITVCFHLSASTQVSRTAFDKKIVITTRSIRIDSLLKVFSRQTGVEFSFNPTRVNPSKTLTVSTQHQTLSQWLTTLRQRVGVQHKVVGNHIILFDNGPATAPAQSKPAPRPSTTPVKQTTTIKPPPQKTTVVIIDSSRTPAQNTTTRQPKAAATVIDTTHTVSPVKQQPAVKNAVPPTAPTPLTKPVSNSSSRKPAAAIRPDTQQPATSRKEERSLPNDDGFEREVFQLMGGYSHHGSGDMKGIVFGASYTRYLSYKFSLNLNIRGTINHRQDNYSYPGPTPGTRTEGAIRFTTAGAQMGVDAQLSVLRSQRHEVMFSLGAFGRYQSASPDGYSVTPPQTSGIPEVLFSLYNWNKQNTIAAGGLLQLHYYFTFNHNILFGIAGGFQTDTNGDAIPQAGLTIGKRF
ncbi:hypothetical protein HB364_22475 [Pseudoflavitalea sp. X16]|uniref:hypothetical protein n=1 Tax=Paraflavitalea devenefica TaxID=2716334 RepID=UPI0014213A0F|nr:hypothetical protein [Paraflavitalea devenefica]NII27866.1 hypothetical protein [Paraflavitalea devenefica]